MNWNMNVFEFLAIVCVAAAVTVNAFTLRPECPAPTLRGTVTPQGAIDGNRRPARMVEGVPAYVTRAE